MDLGESSPISEPERGCCPSTMTCLVLCCWVEDTNTTYHQPASHLPPDLSWQQPASVTCVLYISCAMIVP